MSNNILFVFEGEKTEDQIIDSLKKFYFNQEMIITCAYCNNIYNLYKQLHTDEDLDTFNLLKDIPINKQYLKEYKRTDFAEIYLFFDYDGHDTMADDSILIDLILKFNEETEKGKLYISYPMIESIKHISDFETFRDLKVKCKKNINYKNLVSSDCLKDLIQFKKYNSETWKKVIEAHLKKMNFIVNDEYQLPNTLINQYSIFKKQLEKFIMIDETISVLSSFPMYLHDYYGNEFLINNILDKK